MTGEQLLTAIGLIDDELIEQAIPVYAVPRRQTTPWHKWGAWCACAALVLALGYGATQLDLGAKSAVGENDTASGGLASGSAGVSDEMGANSLPAPSDGLDSAGSPSSSTGESMAATLIYWNSQPYTLTDQQLEQLPQDSQLLGELVSTQPDSSYPATTDEDTYIECSLWQSPQGTIYLQLSNDSYVLIQPVQS